jgi:flagellar biosynthetic protein FliO
MTEKMVKIVAFSLAALASLAAAAPNEPLHTTAPLTNSVFSQDSNFALGADRQFNAGGIYWRMMLAVLLVLALGIAAYYVSKKLGGKIINLPNRQIKLVETLYLGSRKVLHLIKVGNKSIIIGTTPTTITRIAELERDISDLPTGGEPK